MTQRRLGASLLLGAGLALGTFAGLKWVWKALKPAKKFPPHAKIVILGAGFGGVHVAEELAKLLPPDNDCEVTLVDQNNFLLFTPMLTEAAGGQVDAMHVVNSVRLLSPRIRFKQGRIDRIDVRGRSVTVTLGAGEEGVPEASLTLEADHLVIALGSVTNFHGLPGLEEHSLAIKSFGDAAAIRSRALALLERADAEPDADKRRALLTLVVGGGGYSGVETMAAVNDLLRDEAVHYPHLEAADIRAIIVEPGKRLLPELSESLALYAQKALEKRGIETKLNSEISGAGEGYVEIKDGPRIPTHLLIWAGGVRPSPVLAGTDCTKGRHGGLVVDECCAVAGHPGVWALGDCAEIPQPGAQNQSGAQKTYAPTAQNAIREGTQVARNIIAALTGEAPQPFVYTPIGELAIVGKRAGVARVYGLNFSGTLAWAMWRAVYLMKMPGLSKRIRIALDWSLDILFGREIAEMPLARSSNK